MRIVIPNPCNEDWNQMTPVEGGAFCKVCEKKVQDFYMQNEKAIEHFFENKKPDEKVCGRFSVKQVIASNFDDFFSRFRLWSLTKKIALVLFFVFGMESCMGMMERNEHIATEDRGAAHAGVRDTVPVLQGDTLVNNNH